MESDDERKVRQDQFIPVRKSDIIDRLVAEDRLGGDAGAEAFRQFCRMLGAVFHHEYFDLLERLRHDYFYFNPELEGRSRVDRLTLDRAYAGMMDGLLTVLRGANFVEVPHEEISRAHSESALVRVKIHAPVEEYREIRFFRRGHHFETVTQRSWFRLRRRVIETLVYDDVVMVVATRNEASALKPRRRRSERDHRAIRPGAVLLKYFRHIASADLNTLFPNVRVVMSVKDQLMLGIPALVGGIPIILKLASTVTVLFLVAGFYLGLSGAIRDDDLKTSLAALSGLVALGGFIVTQWIKFQRQSLKYQKELTDNVYYRNVNNNAGIFDYIIGAAEDQECKEAFLAYYVLLTAPQPLTQAELDRAIEAWLGSSFECRVDFDVEDAIAKLSRLGLLRRDGDRLSVVPLAEALHRLDCRWDGFFTVAPTGPAAASVAKRG